VRTESLNTKVHWISAPFPEEPDFKSACATVVDELQRGVRGYKFEECFQVDPGGATSGLPRSGGTHSIR
jgi:hypothetical protein